MARKCRETYIKFNKYRLNISFFTLSTFVVSLIYILPVFKIKIPYVISGVLMLSFIPYIYIKEIKIRKYINILVFSSFSIFLVQVLLGTYGFVDAFNEMIRNLRFFIPVLWSVYILKNVSNDNVRIFYVLYIVLIMIIIFKTYNALNENQWISRILAQSVLTDTPEIRELRLQNIGGFEFSYMVGLINICFFWSYFYNVDKRKKLIYLILTIISYMYIIKTMYTTLLLLTSLSLVIILIKNVKNILAKILTFLIFLIIVWNYADIVYFLSELFNGSLLSNKFMQIYMALTEGGMESLGSRPELIMNSISAWLSNPIFGGRPENLNSHSMFFGLLATNGIFGILLLIVVFYLSYKVIVGELIKKGIDTLLIKICFMYIILLMIFNPINYVFEITIAGFYYSVLCIFTNFYFLRKKLIL